MSTADDEDEQKIFQFLDQMEIIGINFPLMIAEGKWHTEPQMQQIKEEAKEMMSPQLNESSG